MNRTGADRRKKRLNYFYNNNFHLRSSSIKKYRYNLKWVLDFDNEIGTWRPQTDPPTLIFTSKGSVSTL